MLSHTHSCKYFCIQILTNTFSHECYKHADKYRILSLTIYNLNSHESVVLDCKRKKFFFIQKINVFNWLFSNNKQTCCSIYIVKFL